MTNFGIMMLIFFNSFLTESLAQVNMQSLRPAFNFNYVLLEDSVSTPVLNETPVQVKSAFYVLQLNTVNSPLVMYDANGDNRRTVISSISTMDLGIQYPLSDRWNASLGLPLHSVSREDTGTDRFAVGDASLNAEFEILNRFKSFWGLSLLAGVYAPTGARDEFVSNESWGGSVRLAIEKGFPYLTWAVNLGGAFYEKAGYQNINYSQQLLLGTGVHVPVGESFAFNLEAQTTYLKAGQTGPGDVYVGGQYALKDNARLDFGFGTANVDSGSGAGGRDNSFRAVLGIKYVPGYAHEKPAPAEKQIPAPVVKYVTEQVTEVEVIKTTERCGPEPRQLSFKARRLSAAERRALVLLPYVSSPERVIAARNIGEMSGLNGGVPFVRDTQVLFAVDIGGLPPEDDVMKIDSARLRLKARKLLDSTGTGARDSEVLCILNARVCSGELHEEASWKANINGRFFQGKETPNDYFVREYLEKAVAQRGETRVYASDMILDISRLIENSLVPDVHALLYGAGRPAAAKDASPGALRSRTLYFAVAPATYISPDAALDVSVTIDSCRRAVSKEIQKTAGPK